MLHKKILIITIFIISIICGTFYAFITFGEKASSLFNFSEKQLTYEAGKNNVSVFDTTAKKEVTSIDLSAKEENITIELSPHDIQTTPNKQYVWVTASASQDQLSALHKNAKEHTHLMMTSDQVIVIDPNTNKIKERIQMGNNIRLSDIVLTSDDKYAYITAEAGNAIYKINTQSYKVDMIQLPPESSPHAIALSEDATKLYTKDSTNNFIYTIATKNNKVISKTPVKETSTVPISWSNH